MKEDSPKRISKSRTSAGVAGANDLIGKDLPHNADAEQGLLASIMLDGSGEVFNTCIESKLKEDYFYFAPHRKIFGALLSLFNEGKAVDEIVLADKLESKGELASVGGVSKIAEIAGRIETYAHFKHWLEIVREKYFLRQLILTCHETITQADQNIDSIQAFLEDVEGKFMAISQDRISDSAKHVSMQIDEAMSELEKLIRSRGEFTGIPTGFVKLDNLTRGFHPQEMIVLAGRPGTGKTSLALNIAENAIFNKDKPVPTLIFSLEMSAKELVKRMLCARAGVNQRLLGDGKVANAKIPDIIQSGKELKDAPLYIDDSPDTTMFEIRAKARRMKHQHNIGLVVVDYLQLIKASDSRIPREQQVAEMSRAMKMMAKELNLPVMVLAQLNRKSEEGEGRDPKASDLRESGAIEQDADLILLLNWKRKSSKDIEENGVELATRSLVKLIIAKQRSGPTGELILLFNRDLTKFYNYEKKDENL